MRLRYPLLLVAGLLVSLSAQAQNRSERSAKEVGLTYQMLGGRIDDLASDLMAEKADLQSQIQWWQDCWSGKLPGCTKESWEAKK